MDFVWENETVGIFILEAYSKKLKNKHDMPLSMIFEGFSFSPCKVL